MADATVTLHDFFERAAQGRLTGIRCRRCGELAVPPRELCPACHAHDWEPTGLDGAGTVASFTIIRVAPRAHAADVPYAIAVVKLTEGVSLLGRIVDVPLDRMSVGLPVRFRPLVKDGRTSVGFGPA